MIFHLVVSEVTPAIVFATRMRDILSKGRFSSMDFITRKRAQLFDEVGSCCTGVVEKSWSIWSEFKAEFDPSECKDEAEIGVSVFLLDIMKKRGWGSIYSHSMAHYQNQNIHMDNLTQ